MLFFTLLQMQQDQTNEDSPLVCKDDITFNNFELRLESCTAENVDYDEFQKNITSAMNGSYRARSIYLSNVSLDLSVELKDDIRVFEAEEAISVYNSFIHLDFNATEELGIISSVKLFSAETLYMQNVTVVFTSNANNKHIVELSVNDPGNNFVSIFENVAISAKNQGDSEVMSYVVDSSASYTNCYIDVWDERVPLPEGLDNYSIDTLRDKTGDDNSLPTCVIYRDLICGDLCAHTAVNFMPKNNISHEEALSKYYQRLLYDHCFFRHSHSFETILGTTISDTTLGEDQAYALKSVDALKPVADNKEFSAVSIKATDSQTIDVYTIAEHCTLLEFDESDNSLLCKCFGEYKEGECRCYDDDLFDDICVCKANSSLFGEQCHPKCSDLQNCGKTCRFDDWETGKINCTCDKGWEFDQISQCRRIPPNAQNLYIGLGVGCGIAVIGTILAIIVIEMKKKSGRRLVYLAQ